MSLLPPKSSPTSPEPPRWLDAAQRIAASGYASSYELVWITCALQIHAATTVEDRTAATRTVRHAQRYATVTSPCRCANRTDKTVDCARHIVQDVLIFALARVGRWFREENVEHERVTRELLRKRDPDILFWDDPEAQAVRKRQREHDLRKQLKPEIDIALQAFPAGPITVAWRDSIDRDPVWDPTMLMPQDMEDLLVAIDMAKTACGAGHVPALLPTIRLDELAHRIDALIRSEPWGNTNHDPWLIEGLTEGLTEES